MVCYLIRHGKDDDTVRGGWSNSVLTPEGQLQVRSLARYMKANKDELKIERLFSSDLPRAMETATPISASLHLKIEPLSEFRETNNGLLAGMPNDMANEKYPGVFWKALEWDEPYPEGESPHMFYKRIKTAWEHFSERMAKENKNTVLVTHSGVIHIVYSILDGKPFSNKTESEKITHATMIPLYYNNGAWVR